MSELSFVRLPFVFQKLQVSKARQRIPWFDGKTFFRGDDDYQERCYQYADTSAPKGTLQPVFILYPKGDEDVIKAIQYICQARGCGNCGKDWRSPLQRSLFDGRRQPSSGSECNLQRV